MVLAPKSVAVEGIDSSTLRVTITPPTEHKGIEFFEATALSLSMFGVNTDGKKTCNASLSEPKCDISGLEVYTEYDVIVKSCDNSNICSNETKASGRTLLLRKSVIQLPFD